MDLDVEYERGNGKRKRMVRFRVIVLPGNEKTTAGALPYLL
jgi:hypothetical protein